MAADAGAPRVAVIGGGWAGLAAAIELCDAEAAVTLYETARHLGGRARSVPIDDDVLDNGQHILVGAYVETLALMRRVGADPQALLWRSPLALVEADGRGLRLPAGPPTLAFVRAVLGHRGWPLTVRLTLLGHAGRWLATGFRCADDLSVAALCRGLPAGPWQDLVEPLCVAALNTPAERASASVFLRVLRDALFSGRGSADLLLPRAPLGRLLPEPAGDWLRGRGAALRLGTRAQQLVRDSTGWRVDGDCFDAVVLACPPDEAARLAQPHAQEWSRRAGAFAYEPIATVVLDVAGAGLCDAMLVLPARGRDGDGPAQFVFDHGRIGGRPGRLVFVISAAAAAVEAGRDATVAAVRRQAAAVLSGTPSAAAVASAPARVFHEKRATFACVPGLARPVADVGPALFAAGDYVAGPYPATLEGAVRSGLAAARSALKAASGCAVLHAGVGIPRYG